MLVVEEKKKVCWHNNYHIVVLLDKIVPTFPFLFIAFVVLLVWKNFGIKKRKLDSSSVSG